MPFILHTFRPFLVFIPLFVSVDKLQCLNFSYPIFDENDPKANDLLLRLSSSRIDQGALQVTDDVTNNDLLHNLSGRIMYKTPFKLWSQKKTKVESFNTTFVFNISPKPGPIGEGLALILTTDPHYIPPSSYGKWLGIVNETTNATTSNPIVAVEFDTAKSFPGDLDDNHVGVDINSVYSENQISLTRYGINISDGTNHTAVIRYNGTSRELNVFLFNGIDVSRSPNNSDLVISMPLNLSDHLPEIVYVGFSASTGIGTELNCVLSWYFTGPDVDSPPAHTWVWVGVSLAVGVVLILVIAGFVYWRIKNGNRCQLGESSLADEIEISTIGPKKYQLKELKSATSNFNPQSELGRGGYGIVYKGRLAGEDVAVKRILKNNPQGRKNMIAEITTIGSLHHKNLVKLTGWCYEKNELLLVYEYMPNGSLDKLLFPEAKRKQTFLSWERRHNIIRGIAQSIDYLHNECARRVLHRDIKTSNIMLDAEFNACLGDFGLARMFKLSEKTHHTTHEIAGTPPYMAPEIFLTGKATVETDVYALGVLALEVVCGRKPEIPSVDGELNDRIVDWVWEFYRLDMICTAVDRKLGESYDKDQAECVLMTGLACCHPNPNMRPSMRFVLQVLMGEAAPPSVPFEKPAFVWPASAPSFSTQELDHSYSGGMLSTLGSFSGR